MKTTHRHLSDSPTIHLTVKIHGSLHHQINLTRIIYHPVMINDKVIQTIYKKFSKLPASPYDLNIGLLFSPEMDCHNISIDGDNVTFGSIRPESPFHQIALDRIHAILEFERHIAVVLPASILFLLKDSPSTHVHLKALKPNLFDRIRSKLSGVEEE